MEKFQTKPNSGALFVVKAKTNPAQPDYRGDLVLQLNDFDVVNNTITVSLSGWKKAISNGTMLSIKAQKPYVKNEAPKQLKDIDDDIPF